MQSIGALEWMVRADDTRKLWKKLTKAQQDKLNKLVEQVIEQAITEE